MSRTWRKTDSGKRIDKDIYSKNDKKRKNNNEKSIKLKYKRIEEE